MSKAPKKPSHKVTWATVRDLARALPSVEESTSSVLGAGDGLKQHGDPPALAIRDVSPGHDGRGGLKRLLRRRVRARADVYPGHGTGGWAISGRRRWEVFAPGSNDWSGSSAASRCGGSASASSGC